jgi:predicted protein tyrosine phosphatase
MGVFNWILVDGVCPVCEQEGRIRCQTHIASSADGNETGRFCDREYALGDKMAWWGPGHRRFESWLKDGEASEECHSRCVTCEASVIVDIRFSDLRPIQVVSMRKDHNHPGLVVMGYSEAAMYLKESSRGVRAVIAIHGQREYPIEVENAEYRLVLQFDDTEVPSETDPVHAARIRLRQRRAAEDGLLWKPPTRENVKAIIDFAMPLVDMDACVLCQCHAGISRSPAAALLCLAAWTGSGNEDYCVDELLRARPAAVPHPDLVAFGDDLLCRDGALVDALRRVGR